MASTLFPKPVLGFLSLLLALAPLTNTNASGATAATTAVATEAPEAVLQKALVSEEARRDLPAAIAAYEQVVRSVDDQRRLAATAVFRLGECYRKSGRTNDAIAQYQRILRDFTAEEVLARLSRQNLTALGAPIPQPPSPAPSGDPALGLAASTPAGTPTANPVATSAAGRAEQLSLLAEEIALLEKQLAASKTKFQNGVVGQEEVWALERQLLQIKRQQVALREAPVRRDLIDLMVPASSPTGAGSGPTSPTGLTGPTSPTTDAAELQRLIARIAEFEQRSPKETGALAAFQEAFPDTELANLQKKVKDTENRLSSLQSNTDDNASEISSAESELNSLRSRRQARWDAVLAEQRERAQSIGRNSPAGTPGTADLSPADAAEIARLRALIQQSPDLLNAPTGDPSMAPLHRAAANGQLAVVRFLLDQGAEVNNARSSQNWTALHHAASKGHKAVVELLLDRGADPDARARDDSTPLHYAVNREYREVVRVLIARGAKVDARGWVGGGYRPVHRGNVITNERDTAFTPLHLAAQQGLTNFITVLLAAGADVNAANSFRRTPLHLAVEARQTAALAQLLDAKADPNRIDAYGRTPLQEILDPATRNSSANSGGSRGSDLDLVRLLLSAGADPNVHNPGGATPLLLVLLWPGPGPQISGQAYQADTNLIATLIAAGADPNGRVTEPGASYDNTPLYQAVANKDLASVQCLLDAGARPAVAVGEAAETPLHRAVQNRQKDMVELLLARGADPAQRNRAGLTAEDLVNPKPRTSETDAVQMITSPNVYLSGIPVLPTPPGAVQASGYSTLPQRTRPTLPKPSGPSSDVELAELFRSRAPASTSTNTPPSTNATPASPGQ